MRSFFFILSFLFSFTLFSQTKGTIRFQQLKSEKIVEYNLPLNASVRVLDEKRKLGRIEEVGEQYLVFSYYEFDTAQVNAIKRMDVKRKQKDILFDTLTAASKVYRQIPLDSLEGVEVLSVDGKLKQQAVMLASSSVVLGMSFVLLQSLSTNVDGSFRTEDYFKIAGIVAGVSFMGIFVKKRYKFQKWTILGPSN